MKHNAETEMDLLLRRHARRDGGASRFFDDGGGAKDDPSHRAGGGVHLDADELNAFAEGALPAPARARYASHLADCDACRKVLTELALVNSAANEEERVTVAPVPASKSSWREWLSALFAAPVLRFAVPAFGLLIVGFILFAITRQQRNESTLVAQNEEKQVAQSDANTSSAPEQLKSAEAARTVPENSNAGTVESPLQDQKKVGPGAQEGATVAANQNAPVTSDVKNPEQTKALTKPEATTPADSDISGKRDDDKLSEEAQRNDNFRDRGRAREEERAAAPIAPPAPASAGGALMTEKEKAQVAKEPPKDQPTRQANNAVADGASNNSDEITTAQNKGYGGAKTPNAILSARKRAARPSATTESKSGEDDARDDSETRRVGGRTFRRQGGAWVDTAYSSSRATVTVRRGSEQYRALVADEPAIGNISNQLGGEVIIVWKNRAYRIDSGSAPSERTERKRNE